jgi:RNA polymerase sigma-70 factor (ECF subfamily)
MSPSPKAPPQLRLLPGEGAAVEPAPVDDGVLLAAVRAGDPRAASAFCRRIRPVAERTVHRLLGRLDDDADDLVQNAVIDLVSAIDRFRGECPLDAWVSAVAAHIVYKHLRRRRLERRLFSHLLAADEDGAAAIAPGTSPMPRALARAVLSLLDEMDERRAWAFVLHDVCGYNLREVAQITGSTVTAAQSRLVRGRKELHEKIGTHPDLATMLERDGGETA